MSKDNTVEKAKVNRLFMEDESRSEGMSLLVESSTSAMPSMVAIGDITTRGKRKNSGSEKPRAVAGMFTTQSRENLPLPICH